jgi:disulfide bond formation protein DsbB
MVTTLMLYAQTFNLLYATAGLGVLLVTVLLIYDYTNGQRWYRRFVAPWQWPLITLTTFGGVATTLLYSEVFGFIPCSLCWLQRVALYAQTLMSVAAWRVKDTIYFPLYGIVLSGFGLAVALYQYIYQAVPKTLLESGALPCLADGTADCSKKVMEVYGFVTFPFLSAVLFAFLIVLFLHMRKAQRG